MTIISKYQNVQFRVWCGRNIEIGQGRDMYMKKGRDLDLSDKEMK